MRRRGCVPVAAANARVGLGRQSPWARTVSAMAHSALGTSNRRVGVGLAEDNKRRSQDLRGSGDASLCAHTHFGGWTCELRNGAKPRRPPSHRGRSTFISKQKACNQFPDHRVYQAICEVTSRPGCVLPQRLGHIDLLMGSLSRPLRMVEWTSAELGNSTTVASCAECSGRAIVVRLRHPKDSSCPPPATTIVTRL
jgi:hypothetical protein